MQNQFEIQRLQEQKNQKQKKQKKKKHDLTCKYKYNFLM